MKAEITGDAIRFSGSIKVLGMKILDRITPT